MKIKRELQHMTWKEIEEVFSRDPVVLVPLGSMEEHGPHSPTGDYLAAVEITKRVAEQAGAYCLPTIPFGYSEYFRGFPGTVSLSPQTVISVLQDIFQSLTEHGVTKIVVMNGHAGNAPLVDQAARALRRQKKIMVASLDLWQCLTTDFKKELYGADFNPSGHGGEPVTSAMMYLYPEDMRMDLLTQEERNTKWQGIDIAGLAKAGVGDSQVNMYFNMNEISAIGVMGNPLAASAARGEAIINKITEYGVAFVEKFKKANTSVC